MGTTRDGDDSSIDDAVIEHEFQKRLDSKRRVISGTVTDNVGENKNKGVHRFVTEDTSPRDLQGGGEEVTSKSGRRLTYRSWLWLQQTHGTAYAPLARLVLGGGPEDVWVNKPLKAEQVCEDIKQMYVSDRQGIRQEHVDLAQSAVQDFLECGDTVDDLIKEKNRYGHNQSQQTIEREVKKSAQETADDVSGNVSAEVVTYGYGEGGVTLVRCTEDGCNKVAVPGTILCEFHGGRHIPEKELRTILRKSYEIILASSTAAVETTIDIMANSVDDKTRLKAAEMLLDRAGLRPGVDITVNADEENGGPSAVSIVKERLANLALHNIQDEDHHTITENGNDVE